MRTFAVPIKMSLSMSIAQNLETVRRRLPTGVRLVAVSKTHPVEALQEAYSAGQRAFGENKVQELLQKQPLMPRDVEWHLIGHLQTNKVRQVLPHVCMIHSVDSERLLVAIDREAQRISRTVDCLLQVHIAQEDTKFGLSVDELRQLLNGDIPSQLRNVRLVGLMGMATFTDDQHQVGGEFRRLRALFDEVRRQHTDALPHFTELSMGMSHDYPLAVAAGSTMVRVGSLIFGARSYGAQP